MTAQPSELEVPSFLWHTPTTESYLVRQVSWLAGQNLHRPSSRHFLPVTYVDEQLAAHSCGTAPVSHRIPS